MIIDSHAHYNNNAYKKPFRYLSYDKDGYALKEGNREQLFQELMEANIPYSIEPGGRVCSPARKYSSCILSILDGSFLQSVSTLPDPFLKSGLTSINWLHMRMHLA